MIQIDPTMRFDPPEGCRHRRETESIRQIILHWTGGDNGARTVYKTLQWRQLSYHYLIDSYGGITQFVCDAHAAYHAGRANGNSIGVALTGLGLSAEGEWEKIHNRQCKIGEFAPAQIDSLRALLTHLCRAYGIPRRVATEQTVLADKHQYNGVMGHLHWTTRKIDPGLALMHTLANTWAL
jgi:N-acetyl-anhydromuramyl-L-alanine amidase AmpD